MFFSPAVSYPQINDVQNNVQRELDGLRRRLEPTSRSTPSSDVVVEIPKQDRGVWGQLKPEMTESEVENLLGKPDRVENQAETSQWYWDKRSPRGWARFDKASRRVVEWHYF